VLGIDHDRLAARERRKVDALVAPIKAEDDSFVTKPFLHHPLADTYLVHKIDRTLFKHARPDDGFDVVTTVSFENHRLDALQVQDVRQQEASWTGTDNSYLNTHGSSPDDR
jgi:hypothetical protein